MRIVEAELCDLSNCRECVMFSIPGFFEVNCLLGRLQVPAHVWLWEEAVHVTRLPTGPLSKKHLSFAGVLQFQSYMYEYMYEYM